ncbi:MAG: hypothetical protein A3I65_11900 [Betaproteobacteria bacterium RIFCSPLOWO2_02_FULL_68_150]|nr:MAG: hypothetical protein A3I65_11900 [Betaproteobacteria bacterium RIFCSPLOWO2_02_FULL_68_150]
MRPRIPAPREDLDRIALAHRAREGRGRAVHQQPADLGMRHAQRLDGVLQAGSARAGAGKNPTAPLALQQRHEFAV